jgi:uncharacterized membrane protein YqjE
VSQPSSGEDGRGILQSLRKLAATAVALLQTRVELLLTEIEEERLRLLQLLFWAAGAFFSIIVGLLLLVLLVIALFWDSHRIASIAVLAGIFLAVGAGMAIGARKRMRERPRMFSASLAELRKDQDELDDQLTPR